MGNLKIATRLYGGFAAVVGVLVVMAALALTQMASMNASAKDIIDNIKKRGSAELAIGHEKERFLQDMENELQLAVNLGAITKDQMDDALKYYAYVEGVTAARLAQEKKITDQIGACANVWRTR